MEESATLERLHRSAAAIAKDCRKYSSEPHRLTITSLDLALPIPSEECILPRDVVGSLTAGHVASIRAIMLRLMRKARYETEQVFRTTIQGLFSTEHLGGSPDRDVETTIRRAFQHRYARHSEALVTRLYALIRASRPLNNVECRKGITFSAHAVNILEIAYQNATTLTTRECTLVAQAAGVSHQQVRTWFQNKRNRKKPTERRTASASAVQQQVTGTVVPDQRRVISLPKRLQKKEAPAPTHQDFLVPSRPVRNLPRRSYAEVASSPSSAESSDGGRASPSPSLTRSASSASYSSISSNDSIPENGGFLNPLSLHAPQQQNGISFDNGGPFLTLPSTSKGVNFNFTPPTPLNGDFDIPFDGIWEDGDLNEILQGILNDPSLAASPEWTNENETPSNGDEAAPAMNEGQGGSTELQALLDMLQSTDHGMERKDEMEMEMQMGLSSEMDDFLNFEGHHEESQLSLQSSIGSTGNDQAAPQAAPPIPTIRVSPTPTYPASPSPPSQAPSSSHLNPNAATFHPSPRPAPVQATQPDVCPQIPMGFMMQHPEGPSSGVPLYQAFAYPQGFTAHDQYGYGYYHPQDQFFQYQQQHQLQQPHHHQYLYQTQQQTRQQNQHQQPAHQYHPQAPQHSNQNYPKTHHTHPQNPAPHWQQAPQVLTLNTATPEWKGYENEFMHGGVWDFTEMMGMDEPVSVSELGVRSGSGSRVRAGPGAVGGTGNCSGGMGSGQMGQDWGMMGGEVSWVGVQA